MNGATYPLPLYALTACTGTPLSLTLLNTKKQQGARMICFLFALYVVHMFFFARKQITFVLIVFCLGTGSSVLRKKVLITVMLETNTLLPLSRIVE